MSTLVKFTDDDLERVRSYVKHGIEKDAYDEIIRRLDLRCRRCGVCCTKYSIKQLNKRVGVRCKYLGADNLCSIQSTKPEVCMRFPRVHDIGYVATHSTIFNKAKICPIVNELVVTLLDASRRV
jgi:hypothetical protein